MQAAEHEVEEALQSLREVNRSTPPLTPSESKEDIDEFEMDADPEVMKRISMVEVNLLDIFDKQQQSMLDDEGKEEEEPVDAIPLSAERKTIPLHEQQHAFPCRDTPKILPSPPSKWPQRPLMLRPTPNTSTKIRGIRLAGSDRYEPFSGFCAGCILPINNGTEPPGRSFVIDFESPHFVGTAMMRIKNARPAQENQEIAQDYFAGKKRKFQVIVKGRFKTPLKMSECVTGQLFHRPAGRLPARWIVNSFIKFVSTLAPQLEATLEGDRPKFLTPLVATAHTVLVKDNASCATEIESGVQEPPASSDESVMRDVGTKVSDHKSIPARMKARKKAFNSLAAKKSNLPLFDTAKEYTFEFYQHLLLFDKDDLAVDMGRAIGKVSLAPVTNGQPIKVMSAYRNPETGELDSLWSFDIWHEALYSLAEKAEKKH